MIIMDKTTSRQYKYTNKSYHLVLIWSNQHLKLVAGIRLRVSPLWVHVDGLGSVPHIGLNFLSDLLWYIGVNCLDLYFIFVPDWI